jgi:RhoGEF domain
VSKILDELKRRNLLLNKGPSDPNRSSSERKPLDNRARVVQELVDTERKYVQDLETLQDYMRELEADDVISKDLIHVLFLNLNQLVDFQRRFLIRVETQNDLLPEQQSWGALFVEYVSLPRQTVPNAVLTLRLVVPRARGKQWRFHSRKTRVPGNVLRLPTVCVQF